MLMVVLSCGVLMIEKRFVNCVFHQLPSLSNAVSPAMDPDYWLQLVITMTCDIAHNNHYYCSAR